MVIRTHRNRHEDRSTVDLNLLSTYEGSIVVEHPKSLIEAELVTFQNSPGNRFDGTLNLPCRTALDLGLLKLVIVLLEIVKSTLRTYL